MCGCRVELVGYIQGPSVDGGPIPEVAVVSSGKVQEDPAGEGELAWRLALTKLVAWPSH
jgi:hypothetical protein